jgi:3-oxoacyl-[acyl-carrier-protein] synthase II
LGTVVVTGAGTINALGSGWRGYLDALAEGRCGIGRLEAFDPAGHRSVLAAEVGAFPLPADLPRRLVRRLSRADTLAIIAAREAVTEAALTTPEISTAGIVLGATVGGMREAEREAGIGTGGRGGSADLHLHPGTLMQFPLCTTGTVVASALGLRGPRFTVSTACTSSANAIALAADIIRAGRSPVMLAGGSDVLCRLTYAGFNALQALDPEPCRPFDRERRGLTLGEGAAVLVLEDAEHARARGATPWARLAGHGMTADAHHLTAPRPDGAAAARALHDALAASDTPPEAVDYVNAHGSGTHTNDVTETRIIKAVFGRRAYRLPISSTKSMIGHCLGAAGALEALATVLAVRHDVIPPTLGLVHPDPECDLDFVPHAARRQQLETAVSNLYGFGGTNTSLVFTKS